MAAKVVRSEQAVEPAAGRREDILQTATKLFAEHGYHGVGMRAISEAVGIQPSSLYHWFPSKTDILYAIALEATQAFIATQLPRLEAEGPRAELLRSLFKEHVIYFHFHREQEAVALRELRRLEEDQWKEINQIRHRYQDAIRRIVAEGAAAGEFDAPDPLVATMAALSVLNGVNDWFRERGKKSIQQVAAECAEIAVGRILGANKAEASR